MKGEFLCREKTEPGRLEKGRWREEEWAGENSGGQRARALQDIASARAAAKKSHTSRGCHARFKMPQVRESYGKKLLEDNGKNDPVKRGLSKGYAGAFGW